MNTRSQTLGLLFGLVVLVPVGAACNGVLGITQAAVDPTLSQDAAAPDSGGDADAGSGRPTCAAYCGMLAQSCAGANQEYTSVDTCNAICSLFEPGVSGEQTNDSLACRISQAQKAASAPEQFCQQAGPLGTGSCVPNPCASFCTLTFDVCNPHNVFPYKDEAECRAACARWPYLMTADAGPGPVGDIVFQATNTLNCRIYHLESAAEPDNPNAAKVHCSHLGDPSSTCN